MVRPVRQRIFIHEEPRGKITKFPVPHAAHRKRTDGASASQDTPDKDVPQTSPTPSVERVTSGHSSHHVPFPSF
jgi:hypothetical protein